MRLNFLILNWISNLFNSWVITVSLKASLWWSLYIDLFIPWPSLILLFDRKLPHSIMVIIISIIILYYNFNISLLKPSFIIRSLIHKMLHTLRLLIRWSIKTKHSRFYQTFRIFIFRIIFWGIHPLYFTLFWHKTSNENIT